MDPKEKRAQRLYRHKRIRAKLCGSRLCPRLSVFRSNRHIYAQLIDDEKGMTLLSFSDIALPKTKTTKAKKTSLAYEVGKRLGEMALKKRIKRVVFDRGGYKFHGRVKALAEGARKSGLNF